MLIGAGVALCLAGIARPLLYATVAPQSASARGVRIGMLGGGFLVLLGIDAGEATQAVGALLLLGLVAAGGAAPADGEVGASSRSRPVRPCRDLGGVAAA